MTCCGDFNGKSKLYIFKNIYFFLKQMADLTYHHQNVHMQTHEHIVCFLLLQNKQM